MPARAEEIQRVVDTLETAFAERLEQSSAAAAATARIFAALRTPAPAPKVPAVRYPVCDHLPAALAEAATAPTAVARHAAAIGALAPRLAWRRKDGFEHDARFFNGHANATIVGPGGLEPREDVWVGISLVAPGVTYPDHNHPPEEAYLVLSGGEWRQRAEPWVAPGKGGTIYNPPGIVHAMRAGPRVPLLATWALWAG